MNLLFRRIKNLGDFFTAIIPAVVLSSLLGGLLEILCAWFAITYSVSCMIFRLFSYVTIACVISWILYGVRENSAVSFSGGRLKEDILGQGSEQVKQQTETDEIYSPLCGTVIPIEEVSDETFAAKILGEGVALLPGRGEVYAPFDGIVEMLYETRHAIVLKNTAGVELLIHIGINTVELAGECYRAYVADGDVIHKGDLLIRFDMEGIREAGCSLVTPVILINSDDFEGIQFVGNGDVDNRDVIIRVSYN